MTPVILPPFPELRAIREIIYLLVSNAIAVHKIPGMVDLFIPYEMFKGIMPGLDDKRNIHVYVNRARPWLHHNGFYVVGEAGGYRCYKTIIRHGSGPWRGDPEEEKEQ